MKSMKKLTKILTAVGLACFSGALTCGAIQVQPDFQGTLLITFPDGNVQFVNAGENLPDIPSGSTVEIFSGQLTVSAEPGESVTISCLGTSAGVGGGGSASVSCGEDSGSVKALSGNATIADQNGNTSELAEGSEFTIGAPSPGPDAEPTAAGDEPGTPADTGGGPEPDSRSIESSPSS